MLTLPQRSTPPSSRGSINLPNCALLPFNGETTYWKIFGIKLPVLFERASSRWWNPQFDSKVLENQYWKTSSLQLRLRYRYALMYILVMSISWMVYFAYFGYDNWIPCVSLSLIVSLACVAFLAFTFSGFYFRHQLTTSILTSFFVCALSLTTFANYRYAAYSQVDITTTAMFSICIETILIIYTVMPMPLYACILCCVVYSFVYELLSMSILPNQHSSFIVIRIFLQLCTHLIGGHILIMTEARSRSTFLKVGQSLLVRRDLQIEKQLKEKMIHSVMPPKVADWLMSTNGDGEDEDENIQFVGKKGGHETRLHSYSSPRPSHNQLLPVFRPFNMHRIENVSILYADIVGFTKMSSNKSAEQLVGLLNDLFGRFDYLCAKNGCEKITTLGDCYYCVSGCPEPRGDHAKCCVEMGLGMIKAIQEFDDDTNENVNMRVGVHTGTVLCGIVGTRRFKFDVWSNDVTFANMMESSGKPGLVHISESTLSFLNDQYVIEDGDDIQGVKTYFIGKRKSMLDPSSFSRKSWHGHTAVEKTVSDASESKLSSQSARPASQTNYSDVHNENEQEADIENEQTLMLDENEKNNKQILPDQTVATHSLTTLNSRKDSGIRSDHSSLPDNLSEINSLQPAENLTHRVSGYYTSSMPSVVEAQRPSVSGPPKITCETTNRRFNCGSFSVDPSMTFNESLARIRNFRKQSDLQIIKCVQQDTTHIEYFIKPPISQTTLFFLDPIMEKEYRSYSFKCNKPVAKPHVASPAFNVYSDIFVSFSVFLIVSISCFVLFDTPAVWIATFIVSSCLQIMIISICLHNWMPFECFDNRNISVLFSQAFDRVCTDWNAWHVCGAILACLPLIATYVNFRCPGNISNDEHVSQFFCYLVFVGIIHLCNFTQLNCWMKSILSTIFGFLLLLLVGLDICSCKTYVVLGRATASYNDTNVSAAVGVADGHSIFCHEKLFYELIISTILLVILVWFLNREFEISYRLSFHGNQLALKGEKKIQTMKNQAELLLHNIIPKHVAEQLKSTSKYSENHKNVGVIFASITNFNDMYDESYEGGKEYLRVLNELVGDYDELLSRPEFRNVEKIKTIGSTFMAASGLNPTLRNENVHPYQHLIELMDFAIAMQQVIDNFNSNLLEFNFTLRIGYNFGDVTAGVIGTTKLYYDIWGDAVNIASRMDSTGLVGNIQVSEFCLPVLESLFEFKYRGQIFVKGKDDMNVYTLVCRKKPIQKSPRASSGGDDDDDEGTRGSNSCVTLHPPADNKSPEKQNWV